ncbi:UDP-N-acetylmuramate--L-alanine ligase [Halocola ammonii]
MKVHFIAIGGSAMHNLAIALHDKGYEITGSDDEIFEPSKGRLQKRGLLPENIGWQPELLDESYDAVIIGMHARENNPELARAKELGLKLYSYPEYIYEQTKDKTRVVIGGSHGKTSITSMILHVLNKNEIDHDYMVGAQLEGFDCMVKLTERAPIAILEGDEYLSSPIDRRPKFHLYKPHIGLISGIAWDHINVFPTFENYVDQFRVFTEVIEENGTLIYCESDSEVHRVADAAPKHLNKKAYRAHTHEIREGVTYLKTEFGEYPLQIFGEHNLQNLSGALEVCRALRVPDEKFYSAISSFKGASKRLELVRRSPKSVVYKDFAHSPSKLKATTEAVKKQFPERELIACMELHTFSSLNKEFLQQYKGSMALADWAFIYYSPHTLEHKKLPPISPEEVKNAFNSDNVTIFTDSQKMRVELSQMDWTDRNLLLMSSGNFDGIDFEKLADELIG